MKPYNFISVERSNMVAIKGEFRIGIKTIILKESRKGLYLQ